MEILKLALVGVITILVAYLTICIFSPSKVAASKTSVIHEPVEVVIDHLADLKTWSSWHPYLDSVPGEHIIVADTTINWVTNSGSKGRITITYAADSSRLSFSSAFEKAGTWKTYEGEFLLEGGNRETKVSWIYVGEPFPFLKRPANYVIKEVIEKTMERGLIQLNNSIRDK